MAAQTTSAVVLNARYVAIRAAEARGLTDRLLQAARDRTPGVRRLAMPILYRFWYRDREAGWQLLRRIGDDTLRFPGFPDSYAVETFGEMSLAILNGCRGDRSQIDRLADIWRRQMERIFATPLARLLGQGLVLRLMARPVARVLQRQPPYQPVNFKELQKSFARPDAFRQHWRKILTCLEHPEQGLGPIAETLNDKELPFDVYIMLMCERTLIYHGIKMDPEGTFKLLEQVFDAGCPWFGPSVLYVLFHVLSRSAAVSDDWLDRYTALATAFFVGGRWKMSTAVAEYNFAGHMGWPEVVINQHRPGTGPRILPALIERAANARDIEQMAGLFGAIDAIAFSYGEAPLALRLLEQSVAIGGAAVEERALKSLATVWLQDQPLVDAFLAEHRHLARLRPRLNGVEPAIREEDMPTLLDGLTVQLIVDSDYFRGKVCEAARNAVQARGVAAFLVLILEWVRDEFSRMASDAA